MPKMNDFRKPVVYILDQELRKRDLKNKLRLSTGEERGYKGELQEYPLELIRNSDKKVAKILYGIGVKKWEEELIRNAEGKVYRIKTTYPDKSTKTIQINKNGERQVISVTYV
ncbi:hypothetical protein KPL28_02550 [Clostridium algidicarnis]|uniref:hypothetical protein n=1 Tax=Clostridium algidicarnis TaxID=37659 RepID=UPI001C0B26F3|nr:hypothetical protein [Clostridium algidicarnis]MBU3208513.1 hypothetical protein [Clostridium algidicarnis]